MIIGIATVSMIAKENNALLGDSLYFKFHASI